jgi:hypothetical protein
MSERHYTHILVASDETGSGIPAALKGCHFENTTALNYPIKKGGIKLKDLEMLI